MPAISNVTILPDRFSFTDRNGTREFLFADVPGTKTTLQQVEDWINTWLIANATECQMRVHVFSISPIVLTVGTFNLSLTIPINWWSLV